MGDSQERATGDPDAHASGSRLRAGLRAGSLAAYLAFAFFGSGLVGFLFTTVAFGGAGLLALAGFLSSRLTELEWLNASLAKVVPALLLLAGGAAVTFVNGLLSGPATPPSTPPAKPTPTRKPKASPKSPPRKRGSKTNDRRSKRAGPSPSPKPGAGDEEDGAYCLGILSGYLGATVGVVVGLRYSIIWLEGADPADVDAGIWKWVKIVLLVIAVVVGLMAVSIAISEAVRERNRAEIVRVPPQGSYTVPEGRVLSLTTLVGSAEAGRGVVRVLLDGECVHETPSATLASAAIVQLPAAVLAQGGAVVSIEQDGEHANAVAIGTLLRPQEMPAEMPEETRPAAPDAD